MFTISHQIQDIKKGVEQKIVEINIFGIFSI